MSVLAELQDLFPEIQDQPGELWSDPVNRITQRVDYDDPDSDSDETYYTVTARYAALNGTAWMQLTMKDEGDNQDDPPEYVDISQCADMDEAEELIKAYILTDNADPKLIPNQERPE